MSRSNNVVGEGVEDLSIIQALQDKQARQRAEVEAKERAHKVGQTKLIDELQGVSDPTLGYFCD